MVSQEHQVPCFPSCSRLDGT